MKLHQIDVGFFVFFIGIIWLAVFFQHHPEKAVLFKALLDQNLFVSVSITIGLVFLASLIGNLIPFPTPYILILWLVGQHFLADNWMIPFGFAVIASFGCLLGEIISYFIGRGALKLLDPQKQEKLAFYRSIFTAHPSWAPLLIWGFGATPLSDDILLVPLGMLQYDAKRTFVFCWLGKLTFMTIIAYLPDFFGWLEPGYSFISTILPMLILLTLLWALIRIDWEAIIMRSVFLRKMFGISTEPIGLKN